MTDGNQTANAPQARHALDCPVEHWLAVLGHRWCAMILWHLSSAALRFGELQLRLVGIQPKVLTERLALLVQHGLIERHRHTGQPSTVVYDLTPRGRAAVSIIGRLERLP